MFQRLIINSKLTQNFWKESFFDMWWTYHINFIILEISIKHKTLKHFQDSFYQMPNFEDRWVINRFFVPRRNVISRESIIQVFGWENKIKVSSLCVRSLFKRIRCRIETLKQKNISLDDIRHAFAGHNYSKQMQVIEQSWRQ